MKSTHEQMRARATRMQEMASELVDLVGQQIQDEGVLQSPEIVTIFAVACAMTVVMGHQANPELGSELAGTALRSIVKNLRVHGVRIPDLEMEGWIAPNVQPGNDSQH